MASFLGGRATAATLLSAVVVALAGCSAGGSQPSAAGTAAPPAVSSSMTTSLASADGSAWAVLPMGGSGDNQFWELFTRPAASQQWQLVTPPGVATNGGLVAAPTAGQHLTVAIRPSQGLGFSPLASTSDGGKNWGTGLVDAAVAAAPDALAAGGTSMLTLLSDGTIEQAAAAGTGWIRLAAPGALATSTAARSCQITGLTAIALTPSGTPLAAASCARPGVAGIFAHASGGWVAASIALPASLAGQQVRVLRLTSTAATAVTPAAAMVAILQAGAGGQPSVLAAWSGDGTHWTLSQPLPTGSDQVLASGTWGGSAAWVLLPGGRAATVPGPGTGWHVLTGLPKATAVLAQGQGTLNALAPSGTKLTIFGLGPTGQWQRTQVVNVPILYGSLG
jgi:hypothetical protein